MLWIVALMVVAVIAVAAWWTGGRNKGTRGEQERRWKDEGKIWGGGR